MGDAVGNQPQQLRELSSAEAKEAEGPRSMAVPIERPTEPAPKLAEERKLAEQLEGHPDTIPAPAWFDEDPE